MLYRETGFVLDLKIKIKKNVIVILEEILEKFPGIFGLKNLLNCL